MAAVWRGPHLAGTPIQDHVAFAAVWQVSGRPTPQQHLLGFGRRCRHVHAQLIPFVPFALGHLENRKQKPFLQKCILIFKKVLDEPPPRARPPHAASPPTHKTPRIVPTPIQCYESSSCNVIFTRHLYHIDVSDPFSDLLGAPRPMSGILWARRRKRRNNGEKNDENWARNCQERPGAGGIRNARSRYETTSILIHLPKLLRGHLKRHIEPCPSQLKSAIN